MSRENWVLHHIIAIEKDDLTCSRGLSRWWANGHLCLLLNSSPEQILFYVECPHLTRSVSTHRSRRCPAKWLPRTQTASHRPHCSLAWKWPAVHRFTDCPDSDQVPLQLVESIGIRSLILFPSFIWSHCKSGKSTIPKLQYSLFWFTFSMFPVWVSWFDGDFALVGKTVLWHPWRLWIAERLFRTWINRPTLSENSQLPTLSVWWMTFFPLSFRRIQCTTLICARWVRREDALCHLLGSNNKKSKKRYLRP